MSRFDLTTEEERNVRDERVDFLIKPLPGSEGDSHIAYHNPRTGQEFSLPSDPYHLGRFMTRGLRPGRAPAGLVFVEPPDPLGDVPQTANKERAAYVEQLEERIAKLEALITSTMDTSVQAPS